jgi:recombination associated protein RdgC
MWFKNLQLYRLPTPWQVTPDEIQNGLAKQAFNPAGNLEMQTQGWAPPRDGGELVHTVNRQMMLSLRTEKKLLPASVINQVAKARAAEIEEQQGFKLGRKQMRELKDQVTEELRPRAFSIVRDTRVWIDPVHGWLAIDAAAPAKSDEIKTMLLKSIDGLPLDVLRVAQAPSSTMTGWLAGTPVPEGLGIDQDTELRATGQGNATVRYVGHTLEIDEIRQHIADGKQCTRLAMTWSDRVSFVLTAGLTLKRIVPLDVIKEAADPTARDDAERFDSDFAMMAGELDGLFGSLIGALGGEVRPN